MKSSSSKAKIPLKSVALGIAVFLLAAEIIFIAAINDFFIPDNPVFVSGKKYSAYNPRIILDSSDTPYITWGSQSESVYIKKEDDGWSDSSNKTSSNENKKIFDSIVTSSKHAKSAHAKIEFDSDGLHTQWFEEGKIKRFKIDTDHRFVLKETLTLDSKGYPHMAWIERFEDLGFFKLAYIKWNGYGWVYADDTMFDHEDRKYLLNVNPTNWLQNMKILFGSDGNPHLIFDSSFKILKEYDFIPAICYIKWNGTNWVTADGKLIEKDINKDSVIINDTKIDQIDFALDSNSYPHIVWGCDVHYKTLHYKERAYNRIKYVRWNGENWVNYKGKKY